MRSKLYQVAFLLICVSLLATVLNIQGKGLPTTSQKVEIPDTIDVTYALSEPINTLDPAAANNLGEAKVLANIYEGLVRWQPDANSIEPCLATSWQVSEDGCSWTFHLRQDVTFHDGSPFNAAAVKFSVERQLPPQKKDNMAYGCFTFGMVKAVEVLDDYTIKFVIKAPYSPFLRNLAMPWAAPIVSPTKLTGTGPFYLAKWQDKSPILVANENYWGTKPQVKTIAFTFVPAEQRLAKLQGDEVFIADLAHPGKSKLEADNLQHIGRPAASVGYLGLFNNRKPFNHDKVRRAVCMAIDAKAVAQALYGNPALAANSLLPPNLLGYHKDLHPYSGGTQKAKELLKNYGYPNGLDITLITYQTTRPYNPLGGEALAELIKKQLAPAGIRVTVKAYPWHQFKTALRNQEGDAFLFGWAGDNLDPDNFMYTLLASSEIPHTNLVHYKNSEVDRLISAAQGEPEEQIRQRLYFHAQQIMLQDTPMVFLNYGQDSLVLSKKLKDVQLNPYGIPLFSSAYIAS